MTSDAAVTSAADRDADVPDRRCGNCGANAPGAYCPECGQNTRERLPTFAQFMREATGRYLSLEGKLWKTLLPLLFRPGFLTRAYFAGRRRYIGLARPRLYGEHLVFAAHNHVFLFVAAGLMFAFPTGIARQAVALWIAFYLLSSMRTVYGGSWLGIVARGAALVVVYSVLFAFVTAGLLVVAVLLR